MKGAQDPILFISYVQEDREFAKRLYDDLRLAGIEPWFDDVSLLPGQKIELAERQAIRDCPFFVPLLSKHAVAKGRVVKHINRALEVSDALSEDTIHIVPVRLDDCRPPRNELDGLYTVDMSCGWEAGLEKIVGVVRRGDGEGSPDEPGGGQGPKQPETGEDTSGRSGSTSIPEGLDGPPGPIRNRWALLVGVNEYADPAIPTLRFCVNDVLALAKTLRGLGYTVVALHDDADEERLAPTRENVEAELINLCEAIGEDDLLLVYFACHGELAEGKPLLLTREIRKPLLKERSLPVSEVEKHMRGSDARRLLLFLDACHTGIEKGRDVTDPEFIKNVFESAEGFAVIAASTAQQYAQEWEKEEHGVFSYYLLDGLAGCADRGKKGFVTADDLKNHVLDGLRKWRVEHGGLIQEPNARMEGLGDMIVADFREESGSSDPEKARENSEIQNPFFDTGRITDPDRFFDREELLRRMFEELGKGGNISLVGESQIGKSSVLSMICALGPERLGLRKESFVYLSLEWVRNDKEFYEALCELSGLETCQGWRLTRALSGKRFVLCLDEIEKMTGNVFSFETLGAISGGLRTVPICR